MASTGQNATIYRGGSYEIPVTVTDSAGDPLDLTGKDLHYRVATRAEKAAVLQVDSPDITVSSATATVPLTTARTLTLAPRSYYHELYMIEGGQRHVLTTGTLKVLRAQASRYVAS